jgi:hypothetical protein
MVIADFIELLLWGFAFALGIVILELVVKSFWQAYRFSRDRRRHGARLPSGQSRPGAFTQDNRAVPPRKVVGRGLGM